MYSTRGISEAGDFVGHAALHQIANFRDQRGREDFIGIEAENPLARREVDGFVLLLGITQPVLMIEPNAEALRDFGGAVGRAAVEKDDLVGDIGDRGEHARDGAVFILRDDGYGERRAAGFGHEWRQAAACRCMRLATTTTMEMMPAS